MGEGGFISARTFQQRLERGGETFKIETVWRWCRAKKLDARAIGGEWRIRETEVARVLDVGIVRAPRRRRSRSKAA